MKLLTSPDIQGLMSQEKNEGQSRVLKRKVIWLSKAHTNFYGDGGLVQLARSRSWGRRS